MKPRFFRTPRDFRKWLSSNHARLPEQWVGFYKLASGKPSVTYHEALDEALAFGWIDGVRRSVDASSYVIRFTPRRPKSIWSAVNIARVKVLITAGRMARPGLDVFEARDEARTNRYSFERRAPAFDRVLTNRFESNTAAWSFFQAQPPGYRRIATWWVVSAKKDETRTRRLAALIADCARGRRLGLVTGKQRS